MPLLDQLPEALLPLALMQNALSLTWFDVLLVVALFSAGGILTSRRRSSEGLTS